MIHILIEVACFKSSFPDVTGTGEGKQKESMPKRARHLLPWFLGIKLRTL